MKVYHRKILLLCVITGVLASPTSLWGQPITQIDTTGFDSLLTKALEKNPLLLIKKENVSLQEEYVFQSKMAFLRNLKLGFQFNQSTDATRNAIGIVPKFGFNIQIDFESIFTTPSKIRQAKIDLRKAEHEYNFSRTDLKYELLILFVQFKKAIQSYQIQLEQYQAISDKYTLVLEKFKNGEIALQEYTKAVDEITKGKEDLLRAELSVTSAKAALMKLVDN